MPEPPPVSIIVPYAGLARHLAATLRGLADQWYPRERMQVVVVRCPAGEDPSAAIAAVAHDIHVQVVSQPVPGYMLCSTRNTGLAVADGDIVIGLDDDVVAPPDLVRRHVAAHDEGRVAGFGLRRFIASPRDELSRPGIHARLRRVPDLPQSGSNRVGHSRDWRIPELDLFPGHPHPWNCFHGCNHSYRRDDAARIGGWSRDFDGAYGYEDVDFAWRLAAAGVRIAYVEGAEVLHLEDPRDRRVITRGRHRNLELVHARIPGLRQFRARMAAAERLRMLIDHELDARGVMAE